jgi:hypothetical protein
VNLNPAGLALFSDWARTLSPRPLPRTAVPVPGEYYLDYIGRLADANHLEFGELTGALDHPGTVIVHPGSWKQHQQERLAAARIARLYWDDAGDYLRDPGRFRRMLRPACHRCTARRGIAGPVACHLPPHLTVCRRHRLWIGPSGRVNPDWPHSSPATASPSARTHAAQLDVSRLPEILRAQRRHLAQLHRHRWWDVEAAISGATHTIRHALRIGTWTPRQRQRLHQLDPGTWPQAPPGADPGWQYDLSGDLAIQIAIYPDIVRLAAYNLQSPSTGRREAS